MPTKNEILEMLSNVEDPELGMSIVDLGLVYRVEVLDTGIEIDYTLTSPGGPLSEIIERDIIASLKDVSSLPVSVKVVWEPMWQPDYMTDEAKITLGYPI